MTAMAPLQAYKVAQCPGCGKRFKVLHPGVEGIRTYTCSACGKKFNVKFEALSQSAESAQTSAPAQGIKVATAKKNDLTQKTMMIGAFDPSWSVVTTPAQAVLRVTMHRKFLPATVKTFNLNGYGSWTIGRSDSSQPSDISITGDDSVSRRCAVIETTMDQSGAVFLLKVVKTRNPIFINGRKMANGESIQLQFGDTITMGKTSMTFSNR